MAKVRPHYCPIMATAALSWFVLPFSELSSAEPSCYIRALFQNYDARMRRKVGRQRAEWRSGVEAATRQRVYPCGRVCLLGRVWRLGSSVAADSIRKRFEMRCDGGACARYPTPGSSVRIEDRLLAQITIGLSNREELAVNGRPHFPSRLSRWCRQRKIT